jgi:hypothetical protein
VPMRFVKRFFSPFVFKSSISFSSCSCRFYLLTEHLFSILFLWRRSAGKTAALFAKMQIKHGAFLLFTFCNLFTEKMITPCY